MGALKYSEKADGIGFLYRSAFAFAKGNKEQGLRFLRIASQKNQDQNIASLVDSSEHIQNMRLLAEKVLDEYKKLIFMLPRQDSNLQPSSYSIPLVTKRTGLSHSAKGGSGI